MADDASPESFHDANQTILSPDDTPSSAPASQGNNSGATISSGDTMSPLQQERQLFPAPPTRNPSDDGSTAQYLRRQQSSEGGRESLNMSDVVEEQAENGDDGDSVADAIESAELDECLDESLHDRLECLVNNEGLEVSDCEHNRILLKKGLAPEVSMPSVPSDWIPSIVKAEKGEPTFQLVDNPGKWPEFTYRSKFLKTGAKPYAHHSLPTGARPVPADQEGKRVVDGWEFHYEKWGV
jgi:hypothetical protein